MALAALISACRAIEARDGQAGDMLRATLPLAGATLVEHQVRLAASAGAGSIVILVERLPAALTAAVDRLRRDGVHVEIARGLADAVDRIHPDEGLLLFADGCVVDAGTVARVAAAPAPAILTVPDDAAHARFERIDAAARWGGLLRIDGVRLRRTAAMLGEWDLESTLLRRAVQDSALRIEAYGESDVPPAIVDSVAALAPVERSIVDLPRRTARDWPGRFLFPPIVDLATLPLMRRGIAPRWVAIAGVTLAMSSLPFVLFGWRWTALILLLISGPIAASARRLAEVGLASLRHAELFGRTRAAAATGALLLLAVDMPSFGWGTWLLAGFTPAAMLVLARERRIWAAMAGRASLPVWLASLDGLIWAFLPAAMTGSAIGGIGLLAAYSAGSFAFVQRRVLGLVEAESV